MPNWNSLMEGIAKGMEMAREQKERQAKETRETAEGRVRSEYYGAQTKKALTPEPLTLEQLIVKSIQDAPAAPVDSSAIKPIIDNIGVSDSSLTTPMSIFNKIKDPTLKAIAEKKYGMGKSVADKKFELEQQAKEEKNKEHSQFIKESAVDTLDTIKEVESGIKYFGMGGGYPGQFPTLIPGSPRAKWEANVNKLLSGKIINLMTTMKEASKTGATGFGQLSEKELKVLQEASTALKRNLAPQDAQQILDKMKIKLQKISGENIASFNSEDEALASGVKGMVNIAGRPARID